MTKGDDKDSCFSLCVCVQANKCEGEKEKRRGKRAFERI